MKLRHAFNYVKNNFSLTYEPYGSLFFFQKINFVYDLISIGWWKSKGLFLLLMKGLRNQNEKSACHIFLANVDSDDGCLLYLHILTYIFDLTC